MKRAPKILCVLLAAAAAVLAAAEKRMTIEDSLAMKAIGAPRLSPEAIQQGLGDSFSCPLHQGQTGDAIFLDRQPIHLAHLFSGNNKHDWLLVTRY